MSISPLIVLIQYSVLNYSLLILLLQLLCMVYLCVCFCVGVPAQVWVWWPIVHVECLSQLFSTYFFFLRWNLSLRPEFTDLYGLVVSQSSGILLFLSPQPWITGTGWHALAFYIVAGNLNSGLKAQGETLYQLSLLIFSAPLM